MDPLAEFVRRLRARLRQRHGCSSEDAEDLVQEAMVRFEAHPDRTEIRQPQAFIARTAVNLSIDAARRQRRSPFSARELETCDTVDFSPSPAEVTEWRKRLVQLNEGLATLSSRSRRILLAQRLEGLSYAEIAQRESITVSAVEKRISRSLKVLLQWMER